MRDTPCFGNPSVPGCSPCTLGHSNAEELSEKHCNRERKLPPTPADPDIMSGPGKNLLLRDGGEQAHKETRPET